MSYPYPPMGPGQQPSGGQPGGWGTPPPGGYGSPAGPDWQNQETMMGGAPMPPQPGVPPMSPMGQPPMGPPPMGPPPRKGGSGGVIALVSILALVLVAGAIVGVYYAAAGGDDPSPRASSAGAGTVTPTPGAQPPGSQPPGTGGGRLKPVYYFSMKSWSLWDSLNTQAEDSKPLTLEEVFSDPEAKAQKDTLDNTVFNVQGTGRLDSDCTSAVWGEALKSALRTYGCTQVVRAAYVSEDQRWVGQMAIFNLRDVNAANALIADLDPKTGKDGFLVPVSGPSPVDRFGRGTTGAHTGAYGHFVVVGWAGRADGQSGSSYGSDTISPSSSVQQAGKEFLFHRNN